MAATAVQWAEAGGTGDPHFLFELIVADLHWTSLQIGALAIMAGAAAAPVTKVRLRACRHIAHDDACVARLALRYAEAAGLSAEIRGRLERFYADVAEAQRRLAPFFESAALSASQREPLSRFVPALRKSAQTAADCLAALEAATRRLPGDYAADSVVLRQYLARASAGDLADVDGFGVLKPPRLKQRRQTPRAPASRSCRIVTAAGEFEAMLVNVARDSLGLNCEAMPEVGEAVAVQIGGRRLQAAVARADGTQIGLTLAGPLAIGDPLFTGG